MEIISKYEQNITENYLKKKIGIFAGLSILLSFFTFIVLMLVWPKAPDEVAYLLITLFIGGIILFPVRGFIAKLIQKMLQNQKNALVLFISLSVVFCLSFLFYWFQIRPSQVRQKCHKWIVDQPGEIESQLEYSSARAEYDALYTSCLHREGLW